MSSKPLTPKQEAFAQAYVDLGVAEHAATQAGYSAARYGHQLLEHPAVAARIEQLRGELQARTEFKRDDAVQRLVNILDANLADIVSWDGDGLTLRPQAEIPRELSYAIESIAQTQHGIRVKLVSKLGALEQLTRLLGLDTEGDQASELKTRVALWAELQGSVRLMIEECS